ncbi:MAG: DUF1761 domain-containing protein [Patescibacteria group bacterium]|nr:MAG: DUF1761 domain-containing protein [Patescibacteria group bacterium]
MISDVTINLYAVVVAAAANMALGSLWYGPLFGKAWMKGMGMDPNMPMDDKKKKEGMKAMMWMVPLSLLTAYVLAHFVDYTVSVTWSEGMQAGFWIWLGFQLTMVIQSVLFEGKKKEVAVINAAYQLAGLMLMGGILAVWA